jgi:hypothetical protein
MRDDRKRTPSFDLFSDTGHILILSAIARQDGLQQLLQGKRRRV